jgi:acetyl-CoA carboxylase biotin carboxyl carrier protein
MSLHALFAPIDAPKSLTMPSAPIAFAPRCWAFLKPGSSAWQASISQMARELTHSDVSKILEIVDGAPHLNEIEFVHDGFHFHFHRGAPNPLAPQIPAAASPPLPAGIKKALDRKEATLRAPLPGIFCRSRAPGEASFAALGQRVQADDTICIIQTTAQDTAIKAGVDGVVKHIFPQNDEFVEFDQLLIVLATAG